MLLLIFTFPFQKATFARNSRREYKKNVLIPENWEIGKSGRKHFSFYDLCLENIYVYRKQIVWPVDLILFSGCKIFEQQSKNLLI